MIDLSGIEYNFLPGVLWWLVPVAVIVVFLWWAFTTGRENNTHWEPIIGLWIVLGAVWAVLGGPIMLGAVPGMHVEAEEKRMTIEQLEDQGFANVSLNGNGKFTASVDGQYFRGALVHDHGYTYQVVELAVD